jgi:sugar-specific transcriptional regulator TrmB
MTTQSNLEVMPTATEIKTKLCKKCETMYDITPCNFYYYGNKPITNACKACKRKYNSEYCKATVNYKEVYQKRKEYLINLAKRHNNIKVECIACCKTYCKPYMIYHNKSNKHLKNIQSLPPVDEGTGI